MIISRPTKKRNHHAEAMQRRLWRREKAKRDERERRHNEMMNALMRGAMMSSDEIRKIMGLS